jgi:hypothetical protein
MDVKAHLPVQLSTTVTLSQEHPVRNGFSEAVCKVVRSGLAVTSSKIRGYRIKSLAERLKATFTHSLLA